MNARIETGPGTIQLSDEEALALSSWTANSALGAIRAELSNAVASDVWLQGEGRLVFRAVWEDI